MELCQKSQRQTRASVFHQVEMITFCKVGCQIERIQSIAGFIVFPRYEIALVSIYFVRSSKQCVVSAHVEAFVEIRLQRFQSVLLMTVQIQ